MSCSIRRIIQFKDAIIYQPIRINDNSNRDITRECMFSWSTDMTCWTNWVNYDTYIKLGKNLESDFYFRILINDSLGGVYLNNILNNCYNICLDSSATFLQDFCGESNLFQPYNNLDCAIQLQQQLSDSIVCMLGIPIYYFKVMPNVSSKDYTFKEYVLYNVQSVKQIKLIIPDGQMPSSNPKLTEFDFEWETDWETEISKTQFAKAFGDNVEPTTRDMVYIPMMKRMWEVNAAYDEKNEGLMWRSTTWKLQLVKYNDGTNIDTGVFDELIDNFTSNTYENVFGQYERNEQERQSGTTQVESPKFAATNLYNIFMEDSIRKQYTKNDAYILDKVYNHRSNVVARNIYKFKNENGCITYQKPCCGDSGTIMFIMETLGTLGGALEKDILNFGETNVYIYYNEKRQNFHLIYNDLMQEIEPYTTYMVMVRWNKMTNVSELNIYKYTHPTNVPVYRIRPEMYYFDFENPICEMTGSYNEDQNMKSTGECQIHAYPVQMTNVKYYNAYLQLEEAIKESIKYTTNHDNCVINDLARPLDSGHGYAVR